MYSHVSNTINGLASIRAFGAQKTFEKQFYGYQNDHTSMWFLFIATSRTMGIAMEAICALYILVITLTVMVTKSEYLESMPLAEHHSVIEPFFRYRRRKCWLGHLHWLDVGRNDTVGHATVG